MGPYGQQISDVAFRASETEALFAVSESCSAWHDFIVGQECQGHIGTMDCCAQI